MNFLKINYQEKDSIILQVHYKNLLKNNFKSVKHNKKNKDKNLVLSGGVFMNIKSNNNISKIKGIKNLFIMPSSGDGLAIERHSMFIIKKLNLQI